MRFESMGMDYGRPWEWESTSGSEHSAEEEMSGSLSDMVNSFMEKDLGGSDQWEHPHSHVNDDDDDDVNDLDEDESRSNEAKLVEIELRSLINVDKDTKKATLLAEFINQSALEDSRSISYRDLMTRLRSKSLDAGLCKSKWQKQGHIPGGEHEYVDIILDNTRYIVELNLVELFTIARPTNHYASLLKTVPDVYVGTVEEMKQVVKLMCKAMKLSMTSMDMKVPPWRKREYMKAKWLGCYKRSTKSCSSIKNSNTRKDCDDGRIRDRSVGFEVVVEVKNNLSGYSVMHPCRDEVRAKTRMEHGLLAADFRAHQQPEC